MPAKPPGESSIFDLSLLTPASVQFLVVSDTHYLLPDNAQAAEWSSVSEFPARTERALKMAGTLPHDFAVHLGDVTHEYPETGRAQPAREAALAQFREHGLNFHQAAGNMDIGDKPDPTSPADWVSPATIEEWHGTFGPSWHSFGHGDAHGIVLNTQIMNGPLPEAVEQQRWAEQDLGDHASQRLFLFLHIPIYFVDRFEQALGFYNSLDEPARGWLLGLIQQYGIELVFAGHTHFVALNRAGSCRMYVAPSTATSRAGLAEAFTVVSPDRGRGDVDKLGFYLVRLDDEGSSVHLIRTGRGTSALDMDDPRRLLVTRVSRELPHGRLGVMASHPLGHITPGPVIWPSIVRQPMRDDWRMLACLEMGTRVIRIPASDLDVQSERERLAVLRDEGVDLSAFWVWSDRLNIAVAILAHREQIDAAEIVMPGTTLPSPALLDQIRHLTAAGLSITLAPALRGVAAAGQYHQRTRVGYLPGELTELNSVLQQHGAHLDRVACRLTPGEPVWTTIDTVRGMSAGQLGATDFYLDLASEDDAVNANLTAEAVAAVATIPESRLVIGPLVDLDRSMDAAHGLLDRLSNPRPAFHVARCLNTLLFGSAERIELVVISHAAAGRQIRLRQGMKHLMLVLPNHSGADQTDEATVDAFRPDQQITVYDLTDGMSVQLIGNSEVIAAQRQSEGPVLIISE
ncbi:hypothetical protein BH24CHL4_BH24CHL4_26720 [soil metagenome]